MKYFSQKIMRNMFIFLTNPSGLCDLRERNAWAKV